MPVKKKVTSNKIQDTNKKAVAAKVVEKKVVAAKPAAKTATTRTAALSVPIFSLAGREAGTLSLPKEIFGKEVNKRLLAQAVRVYSTNQKVLPGHTKTRGDVEGSTVKIFRQKGTGRARHGGIRAPIFVGGGIALGPRSRKVKLTLPQKMRKAALHSALSSKAIDKEIMAVSGLEKATGKTKEIVGLLKKMNINSALILTGNKLDNAVRAVRNIPQVDILPANLANAYEVIKHSHLLVTKEGLENLAAKSASTKASADKGGNV